MLIVLSSVFVSLKTSNRKKVTLFLVSLFPTLFECSRRIS